MEAPYFSTAPAGGQRGRLLLVSWHFSPSEEAGALRWQKFASIAWEGGWGLDVIALDPTELQRADRARLDDLPPGLRAYGVRPPRLLLDRAERTLLRLWHRVHPARRVPRSSGDAPDVDDGGDGDRSSGPEAAGRRPSSLPRREARWSPWQPRTGARAWWAWREHIRGGTWARRAARLGERLAQSVEYRAVITCGPPHMVHEAGRLLSRKLDISFAMDLRDPWSLVERLPERLASPVWYRLARRFEGRCVQRAGLVICNTEPAAEAMRVAYPEAADRIIAVMNGYDEEPLPPSPTTGPFIIAYAGSIYLDRDPRPLFQATRRVIRERKLEPDDVRIELVGNVDDYGGIPLDVMAKQEDVQAYVGTGPFLPRRELMSFLARASMLVSLPQDSDLAIPSKVFEYMRFPAWILAMTQPDSATGRVLRHTDADVIPPENVGDIADAIRRRYQEYRARGRPAPAAEAGGQEFSRRRQAEKLLTALEQRIGTA